jgi:hypothetical protein
VIIPRLSVRWGDTKPPATAAFGWPVRGAIGFLRAAGPYTACGACCNPE